MGRRTRALCLLDNAPLHNLSYRCLSILGQSLIRYVIYKCFLLYIQLIVFWICLLEGVYVFKHTCGKTHMEDKKQLWVSSSIFSVPLERDGVSH